MGQVFTEIDKVVASDRDTNSQFGQDVAISGLFAIVGAPNENKDSASMDPKYRAGAAYIYKFMNGRWTNYQKITANDRSPNTFFGRSVSVDGNILVVGAPYESRDSLGNNYLRYSGAAYIFELDQFGVWRQTQKITAKTRNSDCFFGKTVSISSNTVLVGALGESKDHNNLNYKVAAGAAYFYEKNTNSRWVQTQKIVPSIRNSTDNFGSSVEVSGNQAVIGAVWQSHDSPGANHLLYAGASYIFNRGMNGVWSETQKLVASDREMMALFGSSVSIDSNQILIGAHGEKKDSLGGNALNNSGAAYIFRQTSPGNWIQQQKIVAWNRSSNIEFGWAVSIEKDYALVGARNWHQIISPSQAGRTGAVYIYKKNLFGRFVKKQFLHPSDLDAGDSFGYSVEISDARFLVGDPMETRDKFGNNQINGAGAAYFFAPCTPTIDTIMDTACSAYRSPSGNYIWTTSGIYTDSLRNREGCDSILVIDLYIHPTATPPQITSALVENPNCANSSDGQLSVSISGGNPPYFIKWSIGDTIPNINNLDSGQYWVNVTDRFGCSDSMHFILTAPDSMNLQNVTMQKVTCIGASDGQISISPAGGTPTYQYLWNTGDTIPSLTNLSAGIYSVTISDSLGCSITDSFKIEEPAKLQILLVNYLDVLCHGDANGELNVRGLGGTPPYQYSWSTGESLPNLSNLSAGTYNLTVTDSNGCSTEGDFIISEPDSLYIKSSEVREATCGKTNAGVELIVEGGSGNVSIEWSNGQTGEKLQNVTGGKYHVTITDGHGCTIEADFNLGDQSQEKVFFANTFTPNGDGINDTYKLLGNPDCFTNANFQVFNRWGEKLFETNKPFEEFWTGSVDGYAPKVDVYVFIFTSDEFSESGYVKILH